MGEHVESAAKCQAVVFSLVFSSTPVPPRPPTGRLIASLSQTRRASGVISDVLYCL